MDHPDANDTGIDPDLDARFSDLNMSAAPADAAVQDAAAVSSFWPTEGQPFPSQAAAATGFEATGSPLVADRPLAAQINTQQQPSFDEYGQYPDGNPAQPYWDQSYDTAQAGPSYDATAADLSFPCYYDGCHRSFPRQCDLEYVLVCIPSPPHPHDVADLSRAQQQALQEPHETP
jgi:hypothetical protein